MGKKKSRKLTVRYIYEGKVTEKAFFEYLHSCFPDTLAAPLNMYCGRGGTADSLVSNLLKCLYFNKIYLILDEDFKDKGPIGKDNLRKLEREWKLNENELNNEEYRNFIKYGSQCRPCIIFSNPSSIEGILLQILGKEKEELEGKTTNQLKSELSSYIDQYYRDVGIESPQNNEDKLFSFFKAKFSLDVLEECRKNIKELDFILNIFEQ